MHVKARNMIINVNLRWVGKRNVLETEKREKQNIKTDEILSQHTFFTPASLLRD